jgi:carbon storage regulator
VLVLRRRLGETIAIGGDIEIEVIEISRTRVKLGVRAPREVPVLRKETIAAAAENRQALELVSAGPEGVAEALRLLGTAFGRVEQ